MMTINDARQIGAAKLKIDNDLFEKCLEQVRRMRCETAHQGAMSLAIGLLGVSKAQETTIGMENELRDALDVVNQAEKEWRFEQNLGGKARLS